MLGVVNKPQFDTDVFRVGKAFVLKVNSYLNTNKLKGNGALHNIIITEAKPLEITFVHVVEYRDKKSEVDLYTLSIDKVVNKDVEIFELVKIKVKDSVNV